MSRKTWRVRWATAATSCIPWRWRRPAPTSQSCSTAPIWSTAWTQRPAAAAPSQGTQPLASSSSRPPCDASLRLAARSPGQSGRERCWRPGGRVLPQKWSCPGSKRRCPLSGGSRGTRAGARRPVWIGGSTRSMCSDRLFRRPAVRVLGERRTYWPIYFFYLRNIVAVVFFRTISKCTMQQKVDVLSLGQNELHVVQHFLFDIFRNVALNSRPTQKNYLLFRLEK